jgi:hypothetical protein
MDSDRAETALTEEQKKAIVGMPMKDAFDAARVARFPAPKRRR